MADYEPKEQIIDLDDDCFVSPTKARRTRSGRHKGVMPIINSDGHPERQVKIISARVEGKSCVEACAEAGIQAVTTKSATSVVSQAMKKYLPAFCSELQAHGFTMKMAVEKAMALLDCTKPVFVGGKVIDAPDNFVQHRTLETLCRILRLEPEKMPDVNVTLTLEQYVKDKYAKEIGSGSGKTIDV